MVAGLNADAGALIKGKPAGGMVNDKFVECSADNDDPPDTAPPGNVQQVMPRPIRINDVIIWSTGVDWYGGYAKKDGGSKTASSGRVFGIEMSGHIGTCSAETPLDKQLVYGYPTVRVQAHEANAWERCRWRIVSSPLQPAAPGSPIKNGQPVRLVYVGSDSTDGQRNTYLRVAKSNTSYSDDRGSNTIGDFQVHVHLDSDITMNIASKPLRDGMGKYVMYGDQFGLLIMNGAGEYGGRGSDVMAVMKPWEGGGGRPFFETKRSKTVSGKSTGMEAVPVLGCSETRLMCPPPRPTAVTPGYSKTDLLDSNPNKKNAFSTIYGCGTGAAWLVGDFLSQKYIPYEGVGWWGHGYLPGHISERFHFWPISGQLPPSIQSVGDPVSCHCIMGDPLNNYPSPTSLSPHPQFCPLTQTFASCKELDVDGKTKYKWSSCNQVSMCDGTQAHGICGAKPTRTTCPEANTAFCCDAKTARWRCRGLDVAVGIGFSCPQMSDKHTGPPESACAQRQWTCKPASRSAAAAAGEKGEYTCSHADDPVLLCADA